MLISLTGSCTAEGGEPYAVNRWLGLDRWDSERPIRPATDGVRFLVRIAYPFTMATPYEVLGIDENASIQEVRRAYRERVKDAHPDHGGSREAFQRVRTAYERIKARREGAEGAGTDGPAMEARQSRVEYLDYDVLVDQGIEFDGTNVFELIDDADLGPAEYGRFVVEPDETLLEAAENRGFTWPFACRGGACANCAVKLVEGELDMPVNHILPEDLVDRGIRLSCVGGPITDTVQVVFNVKHIPDLEELHLPPQQFGRRP